MTRRHVAQLYATYTAACIATALGAWWLTVRTMPPYRGWPL